MSADPKDLFTEDEALIEDSKIETPLQNLADNIEHPSAGQTEQERQSHSPFYIRLENSIVFFSVLSLISYFALFGLRIFNALQFTSTISIVMFKAISIFSQGFMVGYTLLKSASSFKDAMIRYEENKKIKKYIETYPELKETGIKHGLIKMPPGVSLEDAKKWFEKQSKELKSCYVKTDDGFYYLSREYAKPHKVSEKLIPNEKFEELAIGGIHAFEIEKLDELNIPIEPNKISLNAANLKNISLLCDVGPISPVWITPVITGTLMLLTAITLAALFFFKAALASTFPFANFLLDVSINWSGIAPILIEAVMGTREISLLEQQFKRKKIEGHPAKLKERIVRRTVLALKIIASIVLLVLYCFPQAHIVTLAVFATMSVITMGYDYLFVPVYNRYFSKPGSELTAGAFSKAVGQWLYGMTFGLFFSKKEKDISKSQDMSISAEANGPISLENSRKKEVDLLTITASRYTATLKSAERNIEDFASSPSEPRQKEISKEIFDTIKELTKFFQDFENFHSDYKKILEFLGNPEKIKSWEKVILKAENLLKKIEDLPEYEQWAKQFNQSMQSDGLNKEVIQDMLSSPIKKMGTYLDALENFKLLSDTEEASIKASTEELSRHEFNAEFNTLDTPSPKNSYETVREAISENNPANNATVEKALNNLKQLKAKLTPAAELRLTPPVDRPTIINKQGP